MRQVHCTSATALKPLTLTLHRQLYGRAARLMTVHVGRMASMVTQSAATGSSAVAPAAVVTTSMQHSGVVWPVPGQQQQQQRTLILKVDPDVLPSAAGPDLAAAQAYLMGLQPPDLSHQACPHLYYSWPTFQQQHQQQEQQHAGADGESLKNLQRAAELLAAGQPVAIPTETVYGLAADALSAAAVSAVFAAKGRPSDNPLIVHVSDLDMLAALYQQQQQQQQHQQQSAVAEVGGKPAAAAEAAGCCGSSLQPHVTNNSSSSSSGSSLFDFIPHQYHRLIAAFWPGPLTLLLPASPLVPAAVTAGLPTMAVRMPAHPVARALIAAAGVPLAAPSANTSGRPSPTSAQHVLQDLAGKVAAVVDGGPCSCGVESTVLDGLRQPPVVLRPGGVTAEQMALCPSMAGLQVYQRDFTDAKLEAQPTTPGMKYRHYSPTAPLLLLDPTPAWLQQQEQQQQQQEQAAVTQPHHDQQLQHDTLQQLLVAATNKLLSQVQQQQQQCLLHKHSSISRRRNLVVLLSTCASTVSSSSSSNGSSGAGAGAGGSTSLGWTASSLQALQGLQLQEGPVRPGQQQLQSDSVCADITPPAYLHQHSLPSEGAANGSRTRPAAAADAGCCVGDDAVQVLEYVLGSWEQPELVAQQVFGALRAADALQPALIVVQGLPPHGPGLAVMNRLIKAASQRVAVDGCQL